MTIKTVRSRVLPAASRSWPKTFLKPPLSLRPHSSTPASFQSLHALESRDPHLLNGTFHHVGDFNTWTDKKASGCRVPASPAGVFRIRWLHGVLEGALTKAGLLSAKR